MANTVGDYNTIKVDYVRSQLSELKKQLKKRQNTIKNIASDFKSDFSDFQAMSRVSETLSLVGGASTLTGSFTRAINKIGNILDGLEYVEKYQKEYAKNKKLETEYHQAQITTSSFRAEDPKGIDNVSLAMAIVAEKSAKSQYNNSLEKMNEYKRKADNFFNKSC